MNVYKVFENLCAIIFAFAVYYMMYLQCPDLALIPFRSILNELEFGMLQYKSLSSIPRLEYIESLEPLEQAAFDDDLCCEVKMENSLTCSADNGSRARFPSFIDSIHIITAPSFKEYIRRRLNLESGINFRTKYGHSALHFAVASESQDVLEVLLAHCGGLTVRDSLGLTALHYTAIFNLPSMTRLLLEHGACFNIRDNRGATALDYALWDGDSEDGQEVIRLLQDAMEKC